MGDEGQEQVNGAAVAESSRAGNRERVRRYRSKHRRIDYVPSAKARAIIEAWLSRGLCNCTAGVIDRLVCAGHQAVSGNGPRR